MQNHKNRLIWRKVFLKKRIAKTPNKQKKWWLSFLFNLWNEELKFCYVCDYPMYINPIPFHKWSTTHRVLKILQKQDGHNYIYMVNDKAFKIELYFDSYKSSTGCQRNKKCKNYIQLDQLKMIKRTKNRLKRNIKML